MERKLCHQDLQVRLLAAEALATLSGAPEVLGALNAELLPRLVQRAQEVKSTVQARQGAVQAVAGLVELLKARGLKQEMRGGGGLKREKG